MIFDLVVIIVIGSRHFRFFVELSSLFFGVVVFILLVRVEFDSWRPGTVPEHIVDLSVCVLALAFADAFGPSVRGAGWHVRNIFVKKLDRHTGASDRAFINLHSRHFLPGYLRGVHSVQLIHQIK